MGSQSGGLEAGEGAQEDARLGVRSSGSLAVMATQWVMVKVVQTWAGERAGRRGVGVG